MVTFVDQCGRQPGSAAGGHDVERRGTGQQRRGVLDRGRRAGAERAARRGHDHRGHRLQHRERHVRDQWRRTSRSDRSRRPGWPAPTPPGRPTETAVLTVLSGTAAYEIEADVLRLTNGDRRAGAAGRRRRAARRRRAWRVRPGCSTRYVTGSTDHGDRRRRAAAVAAVRRHDRHRLRRGRMQHRVGQLHGRRRPDHVRTAGHDHDGVHRRVGDAWRRPCSPCSRARRRRRSSTAC